MEQAGYQAFHIGVMGSQEVAEKLPSELEEVEWPGVMKRPEGS